MPRPMAAEATAHVIEHADHCPTSHWYVRHGVRVGHGVDVLTQLEASEPGQGTATLPGDMRHVAVVVDVVAPTPQPSSHPVGHGVGVDRWQTYETHTGTVHGMVCAAQVTDPQPEVESVRELGTVWPPLVSYR